MGTEGLRDPGLVEVMVHTRDGTFAALSDGRVAGFDWVYDGVVARRYLLLEEHVQLTYEPWMWEKAWYADIVQIGQPSPGVVTVEDRCVDVIIGRPGPFRQGAARTPPHY